MTAPVIATMQQGAEQWPGRDLLDGRHTSVAGVLRETLHRLVWAPVLALCAGRLRVLGRPAAGPVVYVANHASHADTVAVRASIGRAGRRHLAVAAADDYFFPTPARAGLFTTMIGVFAFPRHGDTGLRRADELLRAGWSVLLFPQGTRDAGAELRPGVLRLVRSGWTIVPVGIAGTEHVLPKGARRPRRHRVSVAFGPPVAPDDLATLATAIETQRRRAAAAVAMTTW